MKRYLIISLALVGVLFAQVSVSEVDETVKSDGDKLAADLVAGIEQKQADYLAVNGRYFQCVTSHSDIPDDGEKIAPSKDAKTDSSTVSYTEQGIALPDTTSSAVAIDNYDGPQGKGYVIRLMTEKEGKIYTKIINVGPETYRNHDWQ